MVAILNGGGAYGVKTVNPDSRKGEALCRYTMQFNSCLVLAHLL